MAWKSNRLTGKNEFKGKEEVNLQRLYEKAPYWIQNLAVDLKGLAICKRRYNRHFYEELHRFEEGQYSQEAELRDFLLAIKDVEAYRESFTPLVVKQLENGSDVYDIIAKFPIIGKSEVKEQIDKYINKGYTGKCFTMRTSGTTGGGLAFPYSVDFENKQWALWWRYRRSLGIQIETWCGWFGGKRMMDPKSNKPPFWRINHPGRQVMYSSYHMTKETVGLFYDNLKERQLEWLHGYPSHIAKLSSLMIDEGLNPLTCVKWITTGAEGLVGNQIRFIEKAFPNAIIRPHYGQNEGVAIMNQDTNGEWYIEDDFSYVELIPIESDSNLCKIIGTGFFNPAFPLVRYDTGDLVTVERNADGSIKRIISIDGRTSNTIKQPSGHEITEASLSIVLHDYDNIAEAQFHQKTLNDVSLWIVKGRNYSEEDEKALMASLHDAFDDGMNISLKYVKAVERTATGKLRLVVPEFSE